MCLLIVCYETAEAVDLNYTHYNEGATTKWCGVKSPTSCATLSYWR